MASNVKDLLMAGTFENSNVISINFRVSIKYSNKKMSSAILYNLIYKL